MADDNFNVNDFDHLRGEQREANGWGFVREDLEKYGVHLVVDVRFAWDKSAPPELRYALGTSSAVLHLIANRAIMAQLEHDGLLPTSTREIMHGNKENGEAVILRDSGWEPEGSR